MKAQFILLAKTCSIFLSGNLHMQMVVKMKPMLQLLSTIYKVGGDANQPPVNAAVESIAQPQSLSHKPRPLPALPV